MKANAPYKLFAAILILVFLAACGNTAQAGEPTPKPLIDLNNNSVSASAKVVADKWANLSFILGGKEFELYYTVGDTIKNGDKLAALSDEALPQSIILAKADLLSAQRALDDLLASTAARYQAEQRVVAAEKELEDAQKDFDSMNFPRASDDLIDKTQAEIDLAKKQLSLSEDAYKQVQKRPDGDYGKAQAQLNLTNARLRVDDLAAKLNWYTGKPDALDYAEAQATFALAKSKLEDARRDYDRLKEGPDPNDVAVAKAKINAIESIIDQKNLIAPFDGTIIELYGNTGESISPGTPVILLADLSTLQVETTDLAEVDVARVQIGDPVKVTFDALPDTVVTGEVKKIALKNAAGSGVYYTVSVSLDEIPNELRWGMSAFVEITISK